MRLPDLEIHGGQARIVERELVTWMPGRAFDALANAEGKAKHDPARHAAGQPLPYVDLPQVVVGRLES